MRTERIFVLVGLCGALVATPTIAGAETAAGSACPAVARRIDARHSGFSCTTLPAVPTMRWSVTLNAPASYPIIADGRVFVTTSTPGGAYGGSLSALDATTGHTLWGPISLSGTYYYFPLAYDGGRVFVNDFDGTLRAFDAATGSLLWSAETGYFSSEPTAVNGVAWVGGGHGLRGVSETTGTIVAQTVTDGDGAPPAVDRSGVYLSSGCTVYRFSLSASVIWSKNFGCDGGGSGPLELWRNGMYAGTEFDGNHRYAKYTGADRGTFSGVPAFAGTRGFSTQGSVVTAIRASTGAALWSRDLGSTVLAGPVATKSIVYVGTAAGSVIGLDVKTGGVVTTLTLPGAPGGGGQYFGDPSDLAVGNGLLVVPSGSTLTAFE